VETPEVVRTGLLNVCQLFGISGSEQGFDKVPNWRGFENLGFPAVVCNVAPSACQPQGSPTATETGVFPDQEPHLHRIKPACEPLERFHSMKVERFSLRRGRFPEGRSLDPPRGETTATEEYMFPSVPGRRAPGRVPGRSETLAAPQRARISLSPCHHWFPETLDRLRPCAETKSHHPQTPIKPGSVEFLLRAG
jgi:hypothetical protein